MTETNELHAYTNGTDTVVARSPEDATIVWSEHMGENPADYELELDWAQLPRDHVLGIDDERTNDATDGTPLRMTCAEWIAREGRGFLCSTEY